MRFEKLYIENFNCIETLELQLQQINLLLGKNGRGKTTIQQAFRFLFSGKLPAGATRVGEDHVTVKGVLDDGTELARTVYLPGWMRINGKDYEERQFFDQVGKAKAVYGQTRPQIGENSNSFFQDPDISNNDQIWEFLQTGRIRDVKLRGIKELQVIFPNGAEFYVRKSQPMTVGINGKKVTQKNFTQFLQERIGSDPKALDIVTSSEVLTAMSGSELAKFLIGNTNTSLDYTHLRSLVDLPEDAAAILEGLLPAAPGAIGIEDIKETHNIIVTTRRAISKKLKEWQEKAKYEGIVPQKTLKDLQLQMDAINQKIGAQNELKKAWAVYEKSLEAFNKQIETYRAWVREYNALTVTFDKEKLDSMSEQEEALRKKVEESVRQVERLSSRCKPIRKMMEDINCSMCPVCDGKYECTTDKTSWKAGLESLLEENERAVILISQNMEETKKQLEKLVKEREAEQKKEQAVRYKLQLYQKIMAFKKNLPKEPVKPDALADLTQVMEKKAQLETMIKDAMSYQVSKEASKEVKQAENDLALYEQLAKITDPKKGILVSAILNDVCRPFMEHCNTFLQQIHDDMELDMRIDDSFRIFCRAHGKKDFLPIDRLSTGERQLTMLSLMDLVADMTGSKMMLFDDLEHLDQESFVSLVMLLQKPEIKARYDHIILAAVDHTDILEAADRFPELHRV